MVSELTPMQVWPRIHFRLNPEKYLIQLDQYNPQLPLSMVLASQEFQQVVHDRLVAEEGEVTGLLVQGLGSGT